MGVCTKIENDIAYIEFESDKANALSLELLDRISTEFDKISENGQIKFIVLKSEGDKVFCAGANFDDFSSISNEEEAVKFFSGFARLLVSMKNCNKIIIGRCQGKSVGGGVGILSACDYVFATEGASVRLSELSIGIAPMVIAPFVERKMGVSALSDLCLSPEEWKNAYWAEKKGLFSKIFDNIDDLDESLDYFIQKYSTYNPKALSEIKKLLWKNYQNFDTLVFENAKISAELLMSAFTQNNIKNLKK